MWRLHLEDACNTCFMCCKKWTEKCWLIWVKCTSCHRWLHKKCDITLRKHRRWKEVRQEGALYPCPKFREKGNLRGIHRKACGRNGTVCGAHNGIWEYLDDGYMFVEKGIIITYHSVANPSFKWTASGKGLFWVAAFPFLLDITLRPKTIEEMLILKYEQKMELIEKEIMNNLKHFCVMHVLWITHKLS